MRLAPAIAVGQTSTKVTPQNQSTFVKNRYWQRSQSSTADRSGKPEPRRVYGRHDMQLAQLQRQQDNLLQALRVDYLALDQQRSLSWRPKPATTGAALRA